MANGIGGAPDVSNLLTTAETIRQGNNVVEQPSTFEKFFGRGTLNERLDRGFQVLSPEFRQVREQQERLKTEEGLARRQEERTEQEFQQQNRFIAFDDAFRDSEPSVRKFLTNKARQLGIIIEEDGREGVRAGEGQKALQELQDEPQEIIGLNNLAISDHRKTLGSLKEAEKKEIDKMMSSAMKEIPNASPLEVRERIMKASRDPAGQTDILRQINADKEFLNEKILTLRNENASLSEQADSLAGITPSTREIIRGETDPVIAAALEEKQEQKLEVAEAMSGIKAEAKEEAAQKELGRKARPIQQAVAELREMVDTVFTAEGLIDRAIFTAEGKIADIAQLNEVQRNIVLFNTLSEALVPPLARFLTNEKGPLTESDKAPARALMPKIGDGKPLAQSKMDLIGRLLSGAAGEEPRQITKTPKTTPKVKTAEDFFRKKTER